jgi:hypothetical protein
MENIASSLGFSLPSTSAKKAIMKCFKSSHYFIKDETTDFNEESHYCRTSRKLCAQFSTDKGILRCPSDMADDETASTVSSSAGDSLSSDFFSDRVVSFAEPVVTEIRTRPTISDDEKPSLYYSDNDFRRFRRDFICHKKICRVRFPPTSVVTMVYEYPPLENVELFYYSQVDLQRFLEDFVLSLNSEQLVT